jgi:hypothetical protein
MALMSFSYCSRANLPIFISTTNDDSDSTEVTTDYLQLDDHGCLFIMVLHYQHHFWNFAVAVHRIVQHNSVSYDEYQNTFSMDSGSSCCMSRPKLRSF